METSKKKISIKKIAVISAIVLVSLIIIAVIAVFATWKNEIVTLSSFEKIRDRDDSHLDGAVYEMHVKGGFYLDDFVKQGGVKNDTELINFITGKLTKGLIKMEIENPDIGCSSFTAQTVDGDKLFARNYDFSKTNTCIVYTEANEGRHASVSTVDLQFLGMDVNSDVTGLMDKITCLAAPYAPLDGMNDAGVSCGIYMTYQGKETVATNQNTDKPDFTSTTLLRLILDYAGSVDEAVEIAKNYDLHDSANTSYHYMVADASGRSVILEWTYGNDETDNDGGKRELNVIYNDDDAHIGEKEAESGYQVITNFVLQPGYYDGIDESEKKGYDRYVKLYDELCAVGGVVADENEAMDIIGKVGRRNWNNDDSNSVTVHSVVYNLTDKTAIWIPNEHYGKEDAVYTLKLD